MMLKNEKPKSMFHQYHLKILMACFIIEKFLESWSWYELQSHGPVPCPVSIYHLNSGVSCSDHSMRVLH